MMKSAQAHNDTNAKTRVQLDLSVSEIERLNWIMDVCDLSSRKDLFNNALTLLEWAVKEVSEGRKVASFDEQTKDRSVLTMPILRSAETHGIRYRSLRKNSSDVGTDKKTVHA